MDQQQVTIPDSLESKIGKAMGAWSEANQEYKSVVEHAVRNNRENQELKKQLEAEKELNKKLEAENTILRNELEKHKGVDDEQQEP